MSHHRFVKLFAIILFGAALTPPTFAQSLPKQYILFLEDAPIVERPASGNSRQQIESRQQNLKSELASRRIQVTGSVNTLLNAVFVVAPASRLAELKSLPGVKGVVPGRRYKLNLNRAAQLLNAPAAWNTFGGTQNAGAGIKIAIIDTGIDQTHPAFQDNSLKAPAGYPKCDGSDCNFTNGKVIVARSYVRFNAAGGDPNNPAADSTPDDYSPRDRVGHGTATASAAAGISNTAPNGLTISGIAPKAYLGNYKVFGSPQVNDFATDVGIIQALEDALNDHMDIASLSLGQLPLTGPFDSGATCGNANGVPCDPLAIAVENAVKGGMVVVIAAGNAGDGAQSFNAPTLNSIESPGYAPSAITVGSTTNSHYIAEAVEVPGSGVPSALQQVDGALGDGPAPSTPIAAPLRDVTQFGDNGLACTALPAGSLNGAFVLIRRGTCDFLVKVTNAQNAGASGVIFYMANQATVIRPGSLQTTTIPAIMISNNDGVALKSFISANPDHSVVIDPAIEKMKSSFNELSLFSSLGPTTGDNAIKPDLVATGGSDEFFTDMFLAAQSYDPLGELYSASRYTAGSGTSFSTPLVSGAAALVKQAHPNFSPSQIKSALINTASQDVTSDEDGGSVGIRSLGAGKLDVGAAVQASITVTPATISFGAPATLPTSKQIQITNTSASTASLSLGVTPASSAGGASVTVDRQSLSLAAGATQTVNVVLSGSLPLGGSYSGFISVVGNGSTQHIPYLFLVGNGVVDNVIAVSAPADGMTGQDVGLLAVKLIDSSGVPVSGEDVSFTTSGGASLQNIQGKTNAFGIASAEAFLGPDVRSYDFVIGAAGSSARVSAAVISQPTIAGGGILNAASFETGKPIAPGSYVSIFGTALSITSGSAVTPILPLAINFVTVSFDVPSAKISVPGHLVYVSQNQVNVQVPWELQGQTSVKMKVTVGDGFGISFGNVVSVQLADYAPAFFEIGAGQVAARDAKSSIITAGNPAQRGQTIQLYANALGPVDNQPASGDPAPSSPLATCKSSATVTIGNQPASVGFCGLAPGFPGLYQLNVTVPSSLTPGTYPITVASGGTVSKASNILVQ